MLTCTRSRLILAVISLSLLAGIVNAGDSFPRIHTAVSKYYPPLEKDAPILLWAERVIQLNVVFLLPLRAMLQISELDGLCSNVTNTKQLECMQKALPLSLELRWPVIEEACPISLVPNEYLQCLATVYGQLTTQEQVLSIRSDRELHISDRGLWRVWKANGKPAVPNWGYIPEARELAESDAIILFVNYVSLRSHEERIRLWNRIAHEVEPRYPQSFILSNLTIQAATMGLENTRRTLKFRWDKGAPSNLHGSSQASRYGGGWNELLREWLTFTRTGLVSSRSLKLPNVSRPPAVIPSATPSQENVAPTPSINQQTTRPSGGREEPNIWVADGPPIDLPQNDFPGTPRPHILPASSGHSANKPVKNVTVGKNFFLEGDSISRKAALDYSRLSRRPRPVSAMDVVDWAELGSMTVDRIKKSRTNSVKTKMIKTAGFVFDAWDLHDAIREGDDVKRNISLIKLVGGPGGVIAMEITGFDDKLMTLENAGYSIPQVMHHSITTAQHMLSPFFLGQPGPYSQLVVGTGDLEQATEAAIRSYEERVRQAAIYKHYK